MAKIELATGIPLDAVAFLGTDEIITVTGTDSVVRRPISRLAAFIETQVNLDPITFGGLVGNVATWAEGNSSGLIPVSKIPNIGTTKITGLDDAIDARLTSTAVLTVGDQTISGVKSFTDLRDNGNPLLPTTGGTLTGPVVFNTGQQFPGTIQAGGTVNGTLGITGDVTIGNTATQVEAFLQTIADAGGRQTISLAVTGGGLTARTANELAFNGVPEHTEFGFADNGVVFPFAQVLSALVSADTFGSGIPDSNINITAALGNYYIIYIDINNWILFETATSTNFDIGETVEDFAFYITNVVANTGTFTTGGTAFLYSNVSGVDVLDFLDFFSTNTPADTEVPWDASVGRTFNQTQLTSLGLTTSGDSFPSITHTVGTNIASQLSVGDVLRINDIELVVDSLPASGDRFLTATGLLPGQTWGVGDEVFRVTQEVERIVGASFGLDPNFRIPTFNWVHPIDEFNTADIIRLRIYEDDVDQTTATPIIDVRKQISSTTTSFTGQEDLGTGGETSTVVLTSSGIDSLDSIAIDAANTFGGQPAGIQSRTFTNPTLNYTSGTSTITFTNVPTTGSGPALVNGAVYQFDGVGNDTGLSRFVATYNLSGSLVTLSDIKESLQFTASIDNFVFSTTGSTTISSFRASTVVIESRGLLYFATDQMRIDRSSQVVAEQFADPVDITLDGRADVGELEVEGQVILDGLQTVDPLIRNKAYTQTVAQLLGTGTDLRRVVLLSDGPTT